MSRIDRSFELMDIIKSTSSKDENWSKDSDGKRILYFRVAFGERQNTDPPCVSAWFTEESLELEEEELVLSQSVDRDIPKDKYDAKKVSIEARDKPRLIDTFLMRLYEDDASPLHHGFLLQMNNLMKATIYWDAALYEDIILSKKFHLQMRT